MRKSLGLGGAAALVFGLLYACVSDETTPAIFLNADGGEAGTPAIDGGGQFDATSADAGAVGDGGITCEAGLAACGGACVDLTSNPNNCNACNHGCGGGTCVVSQCTAALVTTATNLFDFAIDDVSLYMSGNDVVLSCPREGICAGGNLAKLADLNGANYDGMGAIAAANGRIAFVGGTNGHPSIYECPRSGCASLTTLYTTLNTYDSLVVAPAVAAVDGGGGTNQLYFYNSQAGVQGAVCVDGTCGSISNLESRTLAGSLFTGDPQYYYFSALAGTFNRCPAGQAPCVDAGEVANVNDVRQAVLAGNVVAFVYNNTTGRDELAYCQTTGCSSGAPTSIHASLSIISAFTAADTDVYFVDNVGTFDGAAAFTLHTCAMSSCTTPKDLAVLEQAPIKMLIDSQYVWWSNASGEIWRIAR